VSDAEDWLRLDRRILAVNGLRSSSSAVLLVVVLVVFRGGAAAAPLVFAVALLGAAVAFGTESVRFSRTWYRVTADRVELRSGLLQVRHVSVPRDRIRRVELTAGPLHRLFGLSVVSVGTGEQGRADGDAVDLDALATPLAEVLRTQLLDPHRVAGAAPAARLPPTMLPPPSSAPLHTPPPLPPELDPALAGTPSAGTELARLRWGWAPYHLLTFWTLVLPLMALGAAWQALATVGVDPTDREVVQGATGVLSARPWWVLVTVMALLGAVVGVLGSLGAFAVSWYGYRLTREAGERLQLQRGLFTTRTTTLDERRLRGVEVQQSLPARVAGAGRLKVIAHGLTGADQPTRASGDALLPPVPMGTVQEVSALALRLDEPPTAVELVRHPRGARDRRLIRAAIVTLVVAVAATAAIAAGWGPWPVPLAAVVALSAFLVAADSYRSLGHRIHGPHLVTRSGSPTRVTSALQRSGIIGWTITQSFFQRRRGLCTLTATTAAGSEAYSVVDLDLAAAVQVAHSAVPGLLDPIVVPEALDDADRTSAGASISI
jgi:putative membrane protein